MSEPEEPPPSAPGAPPQERELAGIVLALGAPPSAVAAVGSLLEQEPPVEVVAINSGGGDMAGRLRAAGLDVPVIERQERLFVGGVRNLGIAATRAPYVGFLAADCRAAPGWSRHRIEAHRAGHAAVASAVVPSHPGNPFALASHIALFRRRMPGIGRKKAALYGASYDRRLFAEYGLFREDLRVAEDTEFHARLRKEDMPVWVPSVQAIHESPTTLAALLSDQYARGARASDAYWNVSQRRVPFGPRWAYAQSRSAMRMSRRVTGEWDRWTVGMAQIVLPLAIGAYALGGAAAHRRRDRSGTEK